MRIILSLIFAFSSLICSAQGPQPLPADQTSSITGTITEANTKTTLPFAYVTLAGTTKGATTNMDGQYTITNVEPGTYTLHFSFMGYETKVIPNVKVSAAKPTKVNASLIKSSATLDEIVIEVSTSRAQVEALLMDQKESKVMVEAIGAQEFAKKGVSNVAEGVTKITGVTQQKSKGIVVRGLGERYNYLTVNGLPIITGDPDKKIIPLKNFSTDMVRNINVYKTFQPDLSGDFAGASFDIVTKDIPYKPTTTIKVGVGANSQTTFKDFKIDNESSSEFFGIAGSKRDLPSVYGKNLVKLGYQSTPDASKHLFKTGFNVDEQQAPVSTSLEITHGNTEKLKNGNSLGYYIGFSFENSYHTTPDAVLRSLNTQGGYNANYKDVQDYELTTKKSALLALNYKKQQAFELKFNNIFIQTTSNFTREQYGYNSEANDDFFSRLSRYRDITINQSQLLGQWNLTEDKRHQLDFGASYGFGFYGEPDRKMLYTEGRGEDADLFIANSSEPNRSFVDLDIDNINVMANYQWGLGEAVGYNEDEYNSHLKFGIEANQLNYDFFNRVVRLNVDPTKYPSNINTINEIPINTANPDAFLNQGFDQGWLNYQDGSDASKFSKIDETSAAAYLSYDFKVNQWEVVLGVRGEYFKRLIKYRKPTTSIYADFLEVENDKKFRVMPSLNVKYALNETSNLRLAASMTSTRPRVREILPIRYLVGPFDLITGNPELENSTNYNFDLKYELFPEAGGVFSITGFGKYIDAPIETVITPVAGGSSIGFANTEKAVIYGTEVSYQTSFAQLFNQETLEDLKLGINATVMHSEVTLDKTKSDQRFLTNASRKLQGAPPFIINADLSYTTDLSENWNSTFTTTYNVFGERIYAVGGSNLDDIYEQPFNSLNFIWKNKIGDFSVDLKVENILNDSFELQQTPTGVSNAKPINLSAYKYGIDFSLSVGYTF